jgi:catecholate siderophore receptor
MNRRFAELVAVLTLILFAVAGASAQSSSAYHAVVLDSTRAPIAGARVTGTVPQGQPVGAVTNERGEFTLPLPAPGTYTVTIDSDGFRPATERVNAARPADAPREILLQVAGFAETVSVNAARGYTVPAISSATRTSTPLRDVPQSVTVITPELMRDQQMMSIADVVRYVPGIAAHQGENNRDDVVIRGNRSSADFFLNGIRDDVQYYRDLYNLDRVEALKGPNALVFGRGNGGGAINRVVKEAVFMPVRAFSLQAGGHDNRRFTGDLDQPLGRSVAFRGNAMFEDSGSFRNGVTLERGAFNPTITVMATSRTKLTFGYEYLRDERVADRGITSFQGRPADVAIDTFYGNQRDSHAEAHVNIGTVSLEHRVGRAIVRNRTLVGDYDRFYQNYVPGAASADQSQVTITAYNNATQRTNVFNQTDVVVTGSTGAIRHTALAGADFGRQQTDNLRNTGYFNDVTTSVLASFANPTISTPVTFRQSATDANNHLQANVAGAFVQDQADLSKYVQVIGGVRVDRFDLTFHNNRTGETLSRADDLVSPRAGIVFKPVAPVSIYGSYSVSYLPSSGDQFASLTAITEQVKPERFNNYEVGVKWDSPTGLSFTTALYRLDRTNTRATDPNDPTRIVQTGSQRTSGFELGLNGKVVAAWQIAGGYAYQNAEVTSATTAARAGAQVGQVPHHTLSLWNNYQFHPRVSGALGLIYRSDMFAAIDNTVTLPAYTRADGAVYFRLSDSLRLQANVENLTDTRYYVNADSNTNISPGFPRTLRLGLTASF